MATGNAINANSTGLVKYNGTGTFSGVTTTNHAVQVGAASNGLTSVGPSATAGQVLQSGGASADPAYSTTTYPSTAGTTGTILRSDGTNLVNTTATYPATTTANRILYSSATNTVSEITSAANSILSTDGSSVPSFGTSLSNDYTFTTSTSAATRTVTISNTDNTSSSSNALAILSTGGTSSGDPYTRYVVGTTRSYAVGIDNSDSQAFKVTTLNSGTATASSASILQRIDSAGNRTLPLNACCTADLTTGLTNATGDGTLINPIVFTADTGSFFDQNGNYDTGTGLFTAPATGKYQISGRVTFNGLGSSHTSGTIVVAINGSTFAVNQFNPYAAGNAAGEYTATISMVIALTATNTCSIAGSVSGGTKTVGVKGNSFGSYSSISVVLVS